MRSLQALAAITLLTIIGCGSPKKADEPLKVGDPNPPVKKEGEVDPRNTNTRPGDGALLGPIRAAKRTATLVDFDQLKLFIFSYELDHNRMPTKDDVRNDLKGRADAEVLLKKIDEGAIILTGTTDKTGLWMYEVDADKVGGIMCVGGNISRATAEDVKKYLGPK